MAGKNKTMIDVNKFKDVTFGECFKKAYPKLQVPMMGLMKPIWEVINNAGAKILAKK